MLLLIKAFEAFLALKFPYFKMNPFNMTLHVTQRRKLFFTMFTLERLQFPVEACDMYFQIPLICIAFLALIAGKPFPRLAIFSQNI